jgi:hypothetical protein
LVKLFLWKACNDILPTREKLFKREIVPNLLCPICWREPESTCHILWNCPTTQDVWSECKGKLQKSHFEGNDFMAILESLSQRLSEEEMHLMVTVARQIWLRRNKMIFEGDFQAPPSSRWLETKWNFSILQPEDYRSRGAGEEAQEIILGRNRLVVMSRSTGMGRWIITMAR